MQVKKASETKRVSFRLNALNHCPPMCFRSVYLNGPRSFRRSKRMHLQPLFYIKLSAISRNCFFVKKGKKILSTGAAGRGKFSELNIYFLTFLSRLGKNGWPKSIWYRFDETLLNFQTLMQN